ncbi:MAG: formate dehydrogenase accessory sulfurtransferase FdhD [Rhodoferax sp.]
MADTPSAPRHDPPRLSQARAPLVHRTTVWDHEGQPRAIEIPAERPLTLYLDKREIVTLMTLGQQPEWLALGYLCNQGLVNGANAVHSITVDWEVQAAAVRTHAPPDTPAPSLALPRVVTSGCGQGSALASVMELLQRVRLPPAVLEQSALSALIETVRQHDSLYKRCGSVHGCALFAGTQLCLYIEDVGRHNALDSIAGWMALHASAPASAQAPWVLYTTGRLTSEMVTKAALMGVAIVVSRSGMTQMGLELARQLGLCAIGRATPQRFLCFSGAQRLRWNVAQVQQ